MVLLTEVPIAHVKEGVNACNTLIDSLCEELANHKSVYDPQETLDFGQKEIDDLKERMEIHNNTLVTAITILKKHKV